jgi:hypothetical protein
VAELILEVVEGEGAGRQLPLSSALKDGRIKRQTNAAAFGLLSIVGLAVALYFGLT